MYLLAIDPGPVESAWVLYDTVNKVPIEWDKQPNENIARHIDNANGLVIEMIASYGMAVGAEVFETCVWIGRFLAQWDEAYDTNTRARRILRPDVKLHMCNSRRAKDSEVRQRIIDIYGPGKDKAVGLKASPGPLYGMRADCWQALALAITAAETTYAE